MRRLSASRRNAVAALTGGAVLILAASAGAAGASPLSSASAASSMQGTAPSPAARTAQKARPAVVASRVIGQSVKSHPLRAYQLGNPKAAVTVVALAAMHGNERGGLVVLSDLRDGPPVKGVNLWVIPRDNPDGVLRNDRHNATGVDLNRNFATRWKPLTGWYYAGPGPWSEPETAALRGFLNAIDPDYVVSFHSPLHGVDVYGAKDRPFARGLAKHLNLPVKSFNCSGACHGTLTQWFNAHSAGSCVTVELGSSPRRRYLHRKAPRELLHAIGGHF